MNEFLTSGERERYFQDILSTMKKKTRGFLRFKYEAYREFKNDKRNVEELKTYLRKGK